MMELFLFILIANLIGMIVGLIDSLVNERVCNPIEEVFCNDINIVSKIIISLFIFILFFALYYLIWGG